MLLEKKKFIGVSVESLNWQVFPMAPSTDSFYALLELPPGHHNFRFVIDGREMVDRTQPIAPQYKLDAEEIKTMPSSAVTSVESSALSKISLEAPLPKPTPTRDGRPANVTYLN
uniref:5'-AMP-activated protein kinase subunit beta-1 n=1 Tax=Lygus hesperus TaxID=30085 RepID=A0A146LYV8_LYGHE